MSSGRRTGRAQAWQGWRLHFRTAAALLPPPANAWAEYGAGALVVPPARIEHPELIALGAGCIVHEHGWLAARPGPDSAAPAIRIGRRTSIGRFAKIVAGGSVRIGDDVLFAERVYISDVEHLPWLDPESSEPPLTQPAPVSVGHRVMIGVGSVVKPGVTIGDDAYVGAASVVRDDVPEAALVVGNPARIIRIRDRDSGEWRPVG